MQIRHFSLHLNPMREVGNLLRLSPIPHRPLYPIAFVPRVAGREVIGFTELSLIGMLFVFPLEYWRGNGGFGWFEESGNRTYPGFDPLGLTSDYTLNAEIKNGRLAMTALLGFAAQYASTGASPLQNLAGSVAMFATSGVSMWV